MKNDQNGIPLQEYNPSQRNLDAETLDPQELINYFEPNEGIEDAHNPNRHVCAFDRIAKVEGSYYLVAERGVGKTHILRLLSVILEKRGDLAIKIELKERSVYGAYLDLRKKFSKDKHRVLLWKIAILEEVAIELYEMYYKRNTLRTKKNIDKKIRKEFRKSFKNYIPDLLDYLKTYKKEEWINIKKVQHKVEKSTKTIVETIIDVLKKIDISLLPAPRLGVSLSEPINATLPTAGDIDTQNLNIRLDRIENLVWNILGLLRRLKHTEYPDIAHLTKALPDVHSVYVIADGLDQSTDPTTRRDLLALTEATRDLNRKLIDKVPEGESKNFKVVTAFRAVTYYYYIERRYPDMEQVRNHVEELRWSTPALKKMMARRIWESEGKNISHLQSIDDKVDEIINQKFPVRMHYFGKVFGSEESGSKEYKSSVEFFFKLAGYRPRQIFQLWQDCAEHASKKDITFQAILSEDNIMEGFKSYSMGTLPKDIGEEYEIEYKGLRNFLNFMAANRDQITRIIDIKSLERIIKEFLDTNDKYGKHLGQTPIDIINTMYRIGLIGLPVENVNLIENVNSIEKVKLDWVALRHVYDDRNLDMQHYELVGFLPKMWNYLTNIRQETLMRRMYSLKLYTSIKKITGLLTTTLTKPVDRIQLEYEIGSFLVLGLLVKEFNGYPEPADRIAKCKAWNAINNSWIALGEVTTRQLGDTKSGVEKIEELAENLIPFILKKNKLFEYDVYTLDEFKLRIFDSLQYNTIIEPIKNWYLLYADEKLPLITQRFIDSLNENQISITGDVGSAIEEINRLTKYQEM
jgi:hypothetical protein